MDETIGPNKPFRDLALGLAQRGIATLRYHKRSYEHRLRLALLPHLTVKQEVIDDVVAGARFLRHRFPDVPLVIIGHSLGAMLLGRIGEAVRADAYVALAAPARPLEVAALEQLHYLATLDGERGTRALELLPRVVAAVSRIQAPDLSPDEPPHAFLGAPGSYWLDLRGYAPAASAAALNSPLLVLQGGRDYQVTVAEFEEWRAALRHREDARCQLFPTLNHLFMPGSDPPTPADYDVCSRVDEEVIITISDWIRSL